MITTTEKISSPNSFLLTYCPQTEPLLFFDIETTGFSPRSSSVYLIGIVSVRDEDACYTQWLAEDETEEADVIRSFLKLVTPDCRLIHFNGNRFDLPFLKTRSLQLGLDFIPNSIKSLDLFRKLKPLKNLLKLPRMNQKTLEGFLGLQREDRCDGGELIPVYKSFVQTKAPYAKNMLLLHNREDLIGMLQLGMLFPYLNILNGCFTMDSLKLAEEQEPVFSLLVTLTLPAPVPKTISCKLSAGYLTASGLVCKIQVKGYCGELKYFFPDYKNYYFLPEEDCAIHKSVARFLGHDYRVPAKASNCYQKKNGYFLPQSAAPVLPSFKSEYSHTLSYFECTQDFLEDQEKLLSYLSDLVQNPVSV